MAGSNRKKKKWINKEEKTEFLMALSRYSGAIISKTQKDQTEKNNEICLNVCSDFLAVGVWVMVAKSGRKIFRSGEMWNSL